MSNRGSDTPAEIIDYISIQSGCSKELAKKILMAVSGWDGKIIIQSKDYPGSLIQHLK